MVTLHQMLLEVGQGKETTPLLLLVVLVLAFMELVIQVVREMVEEEVLEE
jgi:hypothetical protein